VTGKRREIRIRLAGPDEARTVAEIHVRAWQWAYHGQIPRHILDGLSVDRREGWWREVIQEHRDHRVWVAERDGEIVGFAATQPSEAEDAGPEVAQIAAIYLDESVVGTGIGRALTRHAIEDFRARGFHTVIWWVLETNERTRRFLERGGWHLDGATKSEDARGFELREIRYSIGTG
jgi:L-amino acid N-acyltransferase YncA